MSNHDYITQKEIQTLCPILTYRSVRLRERSLGLFECRIEGYKRPILYRKSLVIVALVRAGLLKDVAS